MKISTLSIITMLIISNVIVMFITPVSADENQPQWPTPTSWVLADTDSNESGYNDDYRDVKNAYYYVDNYYIYLRLECYGYPNFTVEPEGRYKWYIDIDDPHNMSWQGGKVYEADYILFVEDSPKPGGDGTGEIYLLNDVDGDGFVGNDWHNYLDNPGPILNTSIVGYRIEGNCIDVYLRQENISNPINSYFTWATDQEDPNLDASDGEKSENYWNEDLSKADVGIIKSDSADPVYSVESFSYIINITNHGPNDAYNVSVADTIPSGISFVSSYPYFNFSCGSVYYWNYSYLGVGDTELIEINVTVNNGFVGNVTNSVHVLNETRDPMPGNNDDVEQTTVYSSADLSISKSSNVENVYPGQYVEYTINVTNNGPNTAINMNITDQLPSQVTFNSANPFPNGNSNSTYWWNFDSIDIGISKIIIINVTVNNVSAGIINNIADVTSDTYDPVIENNDYNKQVSIDSSANLIITKKASTTDLVYVGDYIIYTINVTNCGPDIAENVVVYDYLPSELLFNHADPSPSGNNGPAYWWSLGSLGVGGSFEIFINVTIDFVPAVTINNTVIVNSYTYDPETNNNGHSQEIIMGNSADLSIVKFSNVTTTYPGGEIQYTINITNNGPDPAMNINVTDNLPTQVNFINSDPNYTDFDSYTYYWTFASLEVGESKIIIINVTVKNDTIGAIINIANVTSSTNDPDPGDESNEDEDETPIVHRADLGIIKTSNKNKVKVGDSLTYIINVTNYGPDSALDVNIIDILPANVTFVAANPSPYSSNGTTYWWFVPVLNTGDYVQITINVTVNSGASGTIINTAYLTSNGNDSISENNEDSIETYIETYKPPSGGGGGPSGKINQLPIANPNGPYFAYIGEEIEFNGTGSYDNDENGESIVQYDWKFFDEEDWHLNIGATPKYIYNEPGIYNVTLRVLDDEGSNSTNTTTVTISQPNLPPANIIITGEVKGHQNISYSYNISAFDPEGGDIIFTVNWGDGSGDISNPISNGIIYTVDHVWTAPGDYPVTVYATDELGAQDEVTFNVLIDILYVKDIGYLIDYDSDGTYDKFFSNTTKKETVTEKLDDGRYLINDDDDDKWDWIYDPDTDTLEVYYYKEEADMTLWYILLILILISIITLIILLYKKKKKKETPSETTTQL